jgi:hypothetical protein
MTRSHSRRAATAVLCLAALATAFGPSCSFEKTSVTESERGSVVLVDLDGKHWDITTAVYDYGFQVDRFEFGLGKDAIKPLIEPRLLSVGDPGYPGPTVDFAVIGAPFPGDIRAYDIDYITRFEVVDEVVGDAHVAVAY